MLRVLGEIPPTWRDDSLLRVVCMTRTLAQQAFDALQHPTHADTCPVCLNGGVCEFYDTHCLRCDQPHVSKQRTEADRVCGECRYHEEGPNAA
jgi:hypothetical protein